MKMKCPYCKKPLKIPYDKIKQRVLDENPPSYGPWIAAIVAGIGIAGALGLVVGMFLTRSNENKAQILISQLQREKEKLTRDLQTTTTELNKERDKQTATAKLKEQIEKRTNDRQAAIRERQQIEPRQIPGQSTPSRLGQRNLSNIRTLQPDNTRFPLARNSRRGSQPVPVPGADSGNLIPDRPAPSVFQNPELITFLPGERASEIQISSGTGPFGIPQYKTNKAPRGFYFHIVESRINTLAWPKEKIEFDERDGINIDSTDIVLETMDGQLIHPSFASYGMPAGPGSKKIGFAPGPLRNVTLAFGQGAVGDRPAGMMDVHVARPGPRRDLVEVETGVSIDPDRKAYRLYFAFSVPARSQVKEVGLSKDCNVATGGSQTSSRSRTPPTRQNRSIDTPLGTIDVRDVDIEYPKRGQTITVNQYELQRNHVLVIVPVTTTRKRMLTRVSDWSLVSTDGRKYPLVGVKEPDGQTITGIGSMSAAGSPRGPQTTKFLFDVPISAGPLDLYIGDKNLGQVISKEIEPRSTLRTRSRVNR
jgi:hypothetical protein